MKLVRFINNNDILIGAIKHDGVVNLTAANCQYPTITDIIKAGDKALYEIKKIVDKASPEMDVSSARLLAPIERPGKYLAIGMNYAKHLEEADKLGVKRNEYQTWFNKQTTCISGPFDTIKPGVTKKLDYEVELVAVIGRIAKNVSVKDAHKYVFGYCVGNDVSARDWQFHTPTFTMGKSFDTHGPIGPWITTKDDIPDPHNLDLKCWVNGNLRQHNNTRNMIANLWEQISYLSTAFTLEPGDLIATGTPEGVGVGMVPPVFLHQQDVVRCEVEGLGYIENIVE